MKKSNVSRPRNRTSAGSGLRLNDQQRGEIEKLKAMPDEEIDTSDIPELGQKFWRNAVVGKFYRPVKKPVTIRLDADVIAWLKADGRGYQTKANRLLRKSMLADMAFNRRKADSR